jgi:hypothetical protein
VNVTETEEWPQDGKTWALRATSRVLWLDEDGERCLTYREGIATSPDGRVEVRLAADAPKHLVPVEVRILGTLDDPVKAADLRAGITDQVARQAKRMIQVGSWDEQDGWILRFRRGEWQELSDDHAAQAARPRRFRLTDDFLLNEVAPVVHAAEERGEPYTKALVASFDGCNPNQARQWRRRLRMLEEGQS